MSNILSPQTVLFAVLDWGMGHATRTAPLIAAACEAGHRVHVASRGVGLAWLKERFAGQDVAFHEKPGRHISYAPRWNFLHIARQMPGFLRSIAEEREWTADFAQAHGVDRVFSDNCYGVSHPSVPSVLMTHQLHLPVPGIMRPAARVVVRRWCQSFEEIWVPDEQAPASLSGRLGHPPLLPERTFCVGVLSHLAGASGSVPTSTPTSTPTSATPFPDQHIHAVGMVSGPEPHRTLMEDGLRAWLQQIPGNHVVFAGRPGGGVRRDKNVVTHYSPRPEEIVAAWENARFLVCRAGYSTVMDLACQGKPAVLIPTPGQTEQLQIAEHLKGQPGFLLRSQADLLAMRMPSADELERLPARRRFVANALAVARLQAWLAGSST